MKSLLAIFLCLIAINSHAFKPGKCGLALTNMLNDLIAENKLGAPKTTKPDDNYYLRKKPNMCIAFSGLQKENKSWAIYMHKDNVSVIVESTEINDGAIKKYFGPFRSAYKK
jgi:hypothetical protein